MAEIVLFTASTYSHIVNFHRPYLRAFHERGWQVHVACGGTPLPIPEADFILHLPFEKRMSSLSNFQAQKLLQRAMEANHYTLICTHTSLAAFFTRRAAAGLGQARPPVINVAHGYLFDSGMPLLKKQLLLQAERLTAPQTDLLLTMNRWDDTAARRYRLGHRVEKIPGIGVDFSRFPQATLVGRESLRKKLGCTNSDFLVIYAAEFSKRKNQKMLLQALTLLPQRVKLLLPGQGSQLEPCRHLADSLGISDRAVFPGQISDMPLWYRTADAAVSASRSEGLPFNIMEAMYCGLPVVASAVKGHTDLIDDGLTGLLYPFNDPVACAKQLQRLSDDKALCNFLATAAAAAVAPYALEAVLPQVMSAYLSVLSIKQYAPINQAESGSQYVKQA